MGGVPIQNGDKTGFVDVTSTDQTVPTSTPQVAETIVNAPYPYYKTLIWRFLRVSIWSSLSVISASGLTLNSDLSNAKVYAFGMSAGFLAGFCNTLFKLLRDYISSGDMNHPVEKLPI